jgi:hypothetical protein
MIPQFITFTRVRTNETVTVEINSALNSIKTYNDKQEFMNTLGQEDFWKKNRLDLWRDLNNLKATNPAGVCLPIDFVHTHRMLGAVKWRLERAYQDLYQQREDVGAQALYSICDDYGWNKKSRISVKMPRTVQADINPVIIRHEDRPAFERDLELLFAKYHNEDSNKVTEGKQYFRPMDLAQRFVQRYYKL